MKRVQRVKFGIPRISVGFDLPPAHPFYLSPVDPGIGGGNGCNSTVPSHGSPTPTSHFQCRASLKGGYQEAKQHPWLPKSFCGIRWTDTLMRSRLVA